MTYSNNQSVSVTRKTLRGYSEQKLYRMRKLNRLSAKRTSK